MNPSELNAMVSALTIAISECISDTTDLAIVAISITQLGHNLDAIVAQRILLEKKDKHDHH